MSLHTVVRTVAVNDQIQIISFIQLRCTESYNIWAIYSDAMMRHCDRDGCVHTRIIRMTKLTQQQRMTA